MKKHHVNFEKRDEHFQISSMGLCILLLYIMLIWLCELADIICYILNFSQVTVISRIIVGIVFLYTLFLLKRYVKVKKCYVSSLMIVIGILVMVFGVFKCIIPDLSADVMNYHLYIQNPGFRHNFIDNLCPGNFTMYNFRLTDRLFYLFRLLFGYRAGTILNSVFIVLIYFQVTRMLRTLSGGKFQVIRKHNRFLNIVIREDIIAIGVTFILDLLMQSGTYMVELVSVSVALELMNCLWKRATKINAIGFCVLAGFLLCLKMTNIVYIFPMLILMIIKIRNKITLKLFGICFLVGCIPCSIYIIYNFCETGSPLFPWYNEIFKSPFYPPQNFKDGRWGPDTWYELILWPVYTVFFPNHRQSEIPNMFSIAYLGILVAMLGGVIRFWWQRRLTKNNITLWLILSSFYLWAFTTGHTRYYIFGFIIGGILMVEFWFSLIVRYRKKLISFLATGMICLMLCQPIGGVVKVAMGYEWSWRNSIDLFKSDIAMKNVQYFLNDHNDDFQVKSMEIDAFVLNSSFGSAASLVNPDVPIYSNYYLSYMSEPEMQRQAKKIDQLFATKENIYDIIFSRGDINEYIERLNASGMYIESVKAIDIPFCYNDTIYLVKLGKNSKTNTITVQGNKIPIPEGVQSLNLTGDIGVGLHLGWYEGQELQYNICVSDGNVSYNIYSDTITEGIWKKLDAKLQLSSYPLGKNSYIYFECFDSSGNPIQQPYNLQVVNLQM